MSIGGGRFGCARGATTVTSSIVQATASGRFFVRGRPRRGLVAVAPGGAAMLWRREGFWRRRPQALQRAWPALLTGVVDVPQEAQDQVRLVKGGRGIFSKGGEVGRW